MDLPSTFSDPPTEIVKFKCPKCGDHRLEEVVIQTFCNVVKTINVATGTGIGSSFRESSELDRFQCVGCGWVIRWEDDHPIGVVDGPIHLGEWLKERGMLTEEF